MTALPAPAAPTWFDALSLLAEASDELVVRGLRDTHDAWADRLGGYPGRGITAAVHAGVGLGLRVASRGLDRAAALGPALERGARGRFVSASVNGLFGDRLQAERPRLAIRMAVRAHGRDVPLTPADLAAAHPEAGGRVVVFLHGLCEDESRWRRGPGPTYAEALAEQGWTPVLLRANTGLSLRENGVALAALLQDLVEAWPVPVTRLALVGHSMGGLVIRAASVVATQATQPWTDVVSDVVTLGTPHLGAPLARGVGHGSRSLGRLPETAALGRVLDWRSVGVHDLVEGLSDEVPPLPHARYRLVAATVTRRARHPVGHLLGDLLVRTSSAHGRDRRGGELFPGATVLHVGATGHQALLHHPEVRSALEDWLA